MFRKREDRNRGDRGCHTRCHTFARHREPYVERAGDGWAQTVAALTEQLAVKDDQIASLGRALEAAQETAKAAQALHAANVQERALESNEHKKGWRWRWPWGGSGG